MTTAIAKREPRTLASREPFQAIRDDFEGMWRQLVGERMPGWLSTPMMPALDVKETPNAVEVRVDLPGFAADDINVQLANNVLTVSGTREEEEKQENEAFHRIERRCGSFSRSVALPVRVAEEKVDAKFRNGVLTVSLHKCDNGKCRKIKVQE
ncbi:Hsp20/alpha crystallin family protein [Lacipirellula limnantheis]|uniref:Spore protein SP21 n=1 Tax=Lacipirellula limnantheis TaxID=2528024 RepID=A0A517TSS0_9BACT|nr:Hsp20/alpha crystallin family protein [Lacipirellula limnantheis]QDT71427.1 Spore protein SP21 [Lacipirellula limnantheis]